MENNDNLKVENPCPPREEGKGGKPNPKPRRKRYGDNAVDWYTKNKALFVSATSIQTLHVVGDNYDYSGVNEKIIDKTPYDNGITLITMNPTCGGSFDANSPINRAVINFFNVLRGNYTNDLPFQPNDLGFYNIAFGNILAYASHIKRMIQLVSVYDSNSLTIPTALFRTLGLTIKNERKALADNEFELEAQMQRLKTVCVPKNFSYFDKCLWMFRHVYFEDGSGYRGNFIMNVPQFIFKFSSSVKVEDADLYATGLKPLDVAGTTSISEMLDKLGELIDAFILDSTALNISSWIKAKSGDMAIAFDYGSKFATRLALVPAYSEEFKYQILNMRLLRNYQHTQGKFRVKDVNQIVSSGIIYEGNLLIKSPTVPLEVSLRNVDNSDYLLQDWIVTENHEPTADNNMTDTRFLWTCDLEEVSTDESYGNGHYWNIRIYCDTWVAVEFKYISYSLDNTESDGVKLNGGNVTLYWTNTDFELDAYEGGIQFASLLYQSTLPSITFSKIENVETTDNTYEIITDIRQIQKLNYNYLLNKNSIIKLHKAALFSEFASDSYPLDR